MGRVEQLKVRGCRTFLCDVWSPGFRSLPWGEEGSIVSYILSPSSLLTVATKHGPSLHYVDTWSYQAQKFLILFKPEEARKSSKTPWKYLIWSWQTPFLFNCLAQIPPYRPLTAVRYTGRANFTREQEISIHAAAKYSSELREVWIRDTVSHII